MSQAETTLRTTRVGDTVAPVGTYFVKYTDVYRVEPPSTAPSDAMRLLHERLLRRDDLPPEATIGPLPPPDLARPKTPFTEAEVAEATAKGLALGEYAARKSRKTAGEIEVNMPNLGGEATRDEVLAQAELVNDLVRKACGDDLDPAWFTFDPPADS
jgi:hypothetical protein